MDRPFCLCLLFHSMTTAGLCNVVVGSTQPRYPDSFSLSSRTWKIAQLNNNSLHQRSSNTLTIAMTTMIILHHPMLKLLVWKPRFHIHANFSLPWLHTRIAAAASSRGRPIGGGGGGGDNRSSTPHSHYRTIVIEQEEVAPLLSSMDIERQFPVAALFFIFGWYVNSLLVHHPHKQLSAATKQWSLC